MYKTPAKSKYEPYNARSKHTSSQRKSVEKVSRPCNIANEIFKSTPKIKQKYLNHSQTKKIEQTIKYKKRTKPTSAGGKEVPKKDQYFLDKIKSVKKQVRGQKKLSPYPTPMLTPVVSSSPDGKMSFQFLNKESSENVERIRAHLDESTHQITHLKRKSDEKIIEEVKEGQSSLVKQLLQAQRRNQINTQKFNEKLHFLANQNQKLKNQHFQELKSVQSELKLQRDARKIAQDKLAQCQNQIQLLQSKLKVKYEEKKLEGNHSEAEMTKILKDVAKYEEEIYRLKIVNKDLELKVKHCQEEKLFMRKNAAEVLNFIHSEMDLCEKMSILEVGSNGRKK